MTTKYAYTIAPGDVIERRYLYPYKPSDHGHYLVVQRDEVLRVAQSTGDGLYSGNNITLTVRRWINGQYEGKRTVTVGRFHLFVMGEGVDR